MKRTHRLSLAVALSAALALAKAWGGLAVEQLELLLHQGAFWHDSFCGD
jgi:hypothetical protein